MEPHSILNLNERVSCFVDFMKPAARIVKSLCWADWLHSITYHANGEKRCEFG